MSQASSPEGTATLTSRWRDGQIVVGLVIVALVPRVIGLTAESLWYDEAYSVWSSAMDIASPKILWDWQIEFPLYYWLLHFWMRLFGHGEGSVRGLSALAGILTVVPTYYGGKALFGRRSGGLAALLLAVNPYHIWFSQEARMYALAVLFAQTSMWCYWRLFQESSASSSGDGVGAGWGWWLAHTLVTGLAFHLHYYVGWIVLVQNIFLLMELARLPDRPWLPAVWPRLSTWVLDQIGVLLLAVPAFAVFLAKAVGLNQWGWLNRYGAPTWRDVLGLLARYTTGLGFPGPGVLRWLILCLYGVLVVWGILWSWLNRTKYEQTAALWLALLALTVPLELLFVLGQFSPVWVPRYLLFFLPPFLLLAALGVQALRPNAQTVALVLILGASAYALTGTYARQQKEDWRGVAAHIAAQARPGDIVVLVDEECRVPFDYYFGELIPVDASIGRIEVSRFADEDALGAVAEEIDKRMGASAGTTWLVVSHADGSELRRKLELGPLRPRKSPSFVGIELWAYERS